MESKYLSTADAARRLGLGESTLAKLRLAGGGPTFHKFGKAIRYTLEDLDDWAHQKRRRSTSEVGVMITSHARFEREDRNPSK